MCTNLQKFSHSKESAVQIEPLKTFISAEKKYNSYQSFNSSLCLFIEKAISEINLNMFTN